jgi:hypothetical protein
VVLDRGGVGPRVVEGDVADRVEVVAQGPVAVCYT